MTPDISIYSRDFIKLACEARDAAQRLAIAVGYPRDDVLTIPPVVIVRGEAIRIESGTVTGIGNPPVVELNLSDADRVLGTEASVAAPEPTTAVDPTPEPTPEPPKRKRRTKAQIEADEAEARANAAPVAAPEPTTSGAPVCPVNPDHDLDYCEGACEEVQRIANEETEPAEEPPFTADDEPPTHDARRFYMTVEELEQPAGGVNPWRLILHTEGLQPVVRGRHPSMVAALKAAGPARDECTNKGWTEAAPIKTIPVDPPF